MMTWGEKISQSVVGINSRSNEKIYPSLKLLNMWGDNVYINRNENQNAETCQDKEKNELLRNHNFLSLLLNY